MLATQRHAGDVAAGKIVGERLVSPFGQRAKGGDSDFGRVSQICFYPPFQIGQSGITAAKLIDLRRRLKLSYEPDDESLN
jgi:hypothetical protein